MDINWYGQAMFKLKGKTVSVIIDPFNPDFTGLKLPKPSEMTADVVIKTHEHEDHSNINAVEGDPVKLSGPGEYEIKGAAITGIAVFHDNSKGEERGKNTAFNIEIDGVFVLHLGDLGHPLTQEQLDEIGRVDVVLIPVGGTYTIDSKDAVAIVSQLEPKVVIPMHYGGLPGLKFPLEPVETFLKEMGVTVEAQNKYTVTKDRLPDEMQVVVLNKS